MTIKKQFQNIVALLEANQTKKVSTIMDDILLLASSKKKETTFIMDQDGNPFAIYCWYHKQWELVNDTEYGAKASNPTGLSNMCKVGTSKWTKAQRDAAKANQQLLVDVANGILEPSKILDEQANIELARTEIDTTDMPEGTVEMPIIN